MSHSPVPISIPGARRSWSDAAEHPGQHVPLMRPLNAAPPSGISTLVAAGTRSSDLLLPPLNSPQPHFVPISAPSSLPNLGALSPRRSHSPAAPGGQTPGNSSPPLFSQGRHLSPTPQSRSLNAKQCRSPSLRGQEAAEGEGLHAALARSEARIAALEHELAEARAAAHVGRLCLASPAAAVALDGAGGSRCGAAGRSGRRACSPWRRRGAPSSRSSSPPRAASAAATPSPPPPPPTRPRRGPPPRARPRADGPGRDLRLVAAAHAGAGGLPPGLFLLGLDSTEAQRGVHLLMGSVAHEMRTPLNHVLSALQLVALKPDLEPETVEYLRIAEGAAGHLLKLVNDLVEGARAEYGAGPPPKREPFDPRALVEEVASASALAAQQKGLEVVVRVLEDEEPEGAAGDEEPDSPPAAADEEEEGEDAGEEAPGGRAVGRRKASAASTASSGPGLARGPQLRVPRRVAGDVDRIRQCIINLVSNAVKCTASGEVEITLEARAGAGPPGAPRRPALCFSVRDTGLGISAAERHKLFTLFSQTDATLDRKIPGTGLGLAISQRLARRMGGGITVESEAGRGSVFTLAVPLLELSAEETERAIEMERAGSLSRPTSAATTRSDGTSLTASDVPLPPPPASALVLEENAAARSALAAALRARGVSAVCRAAAGEVGPALPPADVLLFGVPAAIVAASPGPAAAADAALAAVLAAREALAGPGGARARRPASCSPPTRSSATCAPASPSPAPGSPRGPPRPPRSADLERALRESAAWLAEGAAGPARWPRPSTRATPCAASPSPTAAARPARPARPAPRLLLRLPHLPGPLLAARRLPLTPGPRDGLSGFFGASRSPRGRRPGRGRGGGGRGGLRASSFSSGRGRGGVAGEQLLRRQRLAALLRRGARPAALAPAILDALRRGPAAPRRGPAPAPAPERRGSDGDLPRPRLAGRRRPRRRPRERGAAPAGPPQRGAGAPQRHPIRPAAAAAAKPRRSPVPEPLALVHSASEPFAGPSGASGPSGPSGASGPGPGAGPQRQRAPSDASDLLAHPAGLRDAGAAPGPPLRVLIADDNPINVKLLRRFLEREGYSVEAATTGTEAVAAFQEALRGAGGARPFDCCLLDLFMPGLSGQEAAERMRELEKAAGRRRTPILACTATNLPADLAPLADSMDDVLPKPVRSSRLYSALRRWLQPRPGPAPGPASPPSPAPGASLEPPSNPAALRGRARSTPDYRTSPLPLPAHDHA
eukprot:tig00001086_g6846.t1